MESSWFVRPYEILSNLDSKTKAELFALGTAIEVEKEELVFHAGSVSDYVYILLAGRIKIYELTPEGKEVILWFCFAGEMFGLAEIIHGSKRAVHAQACSDISVLKINHQRFLDYMQRNPKLGLSVLQLLACRLRELGDMMANLVADDVRSRVIKLLTRLCSRYGKVEANEIRLSISLTHQEMADMIGTTRQTVTTVLNCLKREGALRICNKTIIIFDDEWVDTITNAKMNNGYTETVSNPEQSLTLQHPGLNELLFLKY